MPRKAWIYIGFIFTSGLVTITLAALTADFSDKPQWLILLVLTTLATFAQLTKAEAPDHQLYHMTLVFQFAGVILLQPFYYVMLVAVPHLIEWGRERLIDSIHLRDWYLQPFNICVHVISGALAYIAYTYFPQFLPILGAPGAAIAGAIVYVAFNHVLTGLALEFARGVSLHESGIMEIGNLLTDLIMLLMGYSIARFWQINFWLIWIAMAPLFLIYRALTVPKLERQAQMDPKTGVWNAAYFTKGLQEELARAQGFNRPLTIVMADLDLLRNINNTYGHLAGDVVLQGVARILQEMADPYDTVARFGGEEFAILMPETTAEYAFLRVEAMRIAIAEAVFEVATQEKPLKVTMSFGVAARNGNEQSATELVHCADIAVYQAKQNGRNQTYVYNYKRDMDLKIPTAVTEIPLSSAPNNHNVTQVVEPTVEPANDPPQPVSHKPKTTRKAQEAGGKQEKVVRSPRLVINGYIAAVAILAIILAIPVRYNWSTMDWRGLLAFSALTLLVELLAIELYVKDTTVSTSVAPYLAGVLLFGPGAAVIIAPLIAGVPFFKQKSTVDRLIFNIGNHAISGLICAWSLQIFNTSVLNLPVYAQVLVSVAAAGVIYLSTTWFLAGAVSLYGDIPARTIWKERFRWLCI